MRRYLVLLLLASPFGFVAVREVGGYRSQKPTPFQASDQKELVKLEVEINKRPKGRYSKFSESEVAKAILVLSPAAPREDSGLKHFKMLEDTYKLFSAFGSLSNIKGYDQSISNPFADGHTYHTLVNNRASIAVDQREKYKQLKENGKEARDKLSAKLDELPNETKGAVLSSDVGLRDRFRIRLNSILGEMRKYKEKYKEIEEHASWVDMQIVLLERRRKLAEMLIAERSIKSDDVASHFHSYDALLKSPEPADLSSNIRKAATRFSMVFLPKELPLDEYVCITNNKKRCKREDVVVIWKTGTGKEKSSLKDNQYNEFNISQADVDSFRCDGVNYSPGISGTDKSEAAHFYNEARKKLKQLDLSSLKQLKEKCDKEPHRNHLRDTLARIDGILEAMGKYPELFKEAD